MASPIAESDSETARPGGTRRFWPIVKIALGLAILAWLLRSGSLDLRLLGRLRFGTELAALIVVCGLAIALNSLRWVLLVRSRRPELANLELVKTSLSSNALIYVSPAGTGADAARTIYLSQSQAIPLKSAAGISLLDRVIGLQTLLMVAGIAGVVGAAGTLRGLSLVLVFAAVGLAVVIGAASRKWPAANAGPAYRAYAISVAGAFANLAVPILGVAALTGQTITWSGFCASGMVTLVNSVAPTPGGLGAGEGAASGLLNDASAGAEGMLAARMVLILWTLVLAAASGFGRFAVNPARRSEITA